MKKLIFLLVIVCFCISCFMDEIITGQETHVSFSTTLAGSQTKDVNAAFSVYALSRLMKPIMSHAYFPIRKKISTEPTYRSTSR